MSVSVSVSVCLCVCVSVYASVSVCAAAGWVACDGVGGLCAAYAVCPDSIPLTEAKAQQGENLIRATISHKFLTFCPSSQHQRRFFCRLIIFVNVSSAMLHCDNSRFYG